MSADVLTEIAAAVRRERAPEGVATRIVAIDGLGGAGKSTLASSLTQHLGGAPVIHTDDFASWDEPLDWWPRLVAEALEPLARGEPARFRRTDWTGRGRELWVEVDPAGVVVLEGVGASRAALRPYLTYAIWVETPRDVRLRRGLERDGDGARPRWERWMEEEDEYVARERPDEHAHRVLPGDR